MRLLTLPLALTGIPSHLADARRHVNKMCLAANIPLIESGTSGYIGQVQPIKKDVTECFDCMGGSPARSQASASTRADII